LLRAKQIELSGKSLSLERIAIERSTDELEEGDRGDEGVLESPAHVSRCGVILSL